MAHVHVRREDVTLDDPFLIEGLPGIGLVGKIAADHLVETSGMVHLADIVCEGLPRLAVYSEGDPTVRPPVRLYADEAANLLVLQSDVPISAEAATGFADCTVGWLADNGVTPIFLSGLPRDDESPRTLYGVATGSGTDLLAETDIPPPPENGVVAGPTGALLHRASRAGLPSVGLVVESDPEFPDPTGAHVLLRDGIEPITGIDADTQRLVERGEEIRDQKENLADRMQAAEAESTRAEPLGMYQ